MQFALLPLAQRLLQIHWFLYLPLHPIYHGNTLTCILQQGMQFALLPLAQRRQLPSCFSPPGIPPEMKGWPQIPTHRSTTDSWAPYHQTNSNLQKYPSGTLYRRPFPNTLGICTSMPYGTWNTEGRKCLNACNKIGLPKTFLRQSGNSIAFIDPYPSALSTEENPGLIKVRILPNDHLQTPEGPDKTSDLISTDQPYNCNIDEAPQNSSSPNLIRKVQDWRNWTYTDGSLRHRIRYIPPLLKRSIPLREPKRHRCNQFHLTCRASRYSSRNHSRIVPYSQR